MMTTTQTTTVNTPMPTPFEARLVAYLAVAAPREPGQSVKTISETMRVDDMQVRKALTKLETNGTVRSDVVATQRDTRHFNRKRGGYTTMVRTIKIRHYWLATSPVIE